MYASWPKERLDALKAYASGTGEDFDRDVERVLWTADGRRLALAVRYGASQIDRDELPDLYTVAVCTNANGAWSCDEQVIEERMRATGIPLARNDDGFYARDSFEPLLRRLLEPPDRQAPRGR